MAKPFGLEVKTDINDMRIGDCIPCRYTALTSGAAGTFSELGTCISSEIPISGTATPDGSFYFIKVDKGTLIADRVVQTSISWDALNTAKYVESVVTGAIELISPTTLTSNSSSSPFVISADSLDDSYPPWAAFSQLDKMWYATGERPVGGHWLKIDLGQEKKCSSISLQTDYVSTGRGLKNWILWGSNDDSSYTKLGSGLQINSSAMQYYNINCLTGYRYYRINCIDSYETNINYSKWNCIRKAKIFSSNIVIRSLSGGCAYANSNGNSSLTDKSFGAWPVDNEYDKYIVNSDLDGKITKGDDNVWHLNNNYHYTWCKETPISEISYNNNNRVLRGHPTSASIFTYNLSTDVTNGYGFRPILNYIESDIKNEFIY